MLNIPRFKASVLFGTHKSLKVLQPPAHLPNLTENE